MPLLRDTRALRSQQPREAVQRPSGPGSPRVGAEGTTAPRQAEVWGPWSPRARPQMAFSTTARWACQPRPAPPLTPRPRARQVGAGARAERSRAEPEPHAGARPAAEDSRELVTTGPESDRPEARPAAAAAWTALARPVSGEPSAASFVRSPRRAAPSRRASPAPPARPFVEPLCAGPSLLTPHLPVPKLSARSPRDSPSGLFPWPCGHRLLPEPGPLTLQPLRRGSPEPLRGRARSAGGPRAALSHRGWDRCEPADAACVLARRNGW